MVTFALDGPALAPLASGESLDLLAPDWRLVVLEEVAAVLAGLYRWNGRRDKDGRRTSVITHSFFVAHRAGRKPGATQQTIRAALLHDAKEYVLGDLLRPAIVAFEARLPGFAKAVDRTGFALDLAIGRAAFARFDPGSAEDGGYSIEADHLAWAMRDRLVTASDDEAGEYERAALFAGADWPDQYMNLQPALAAKMWLHALEGAFGAGA